MADIIFHPRNEDGTLDTHRRIDNDGPVVTGFKSVVFALWLKRDSSLTIFELEERFKEVYPTHGQ